MSKINLPDGALPDGTELHHPDFGAPDLPDVTKNQADVFKADAAVAKGKLDVAKEALKTVQSAFKVADSYVGLQSTRVEWAGRIDEAKSKVEIAVQNTEAAREKTRTAVVDLEKTREIGRQQAAALASVTSLRDASVRIIHGILDDAEGLDPEDRAALHDKAIDLAKSLVALKA